MKGVIVQVGEPKSIVLFNNGKISAIPTPLDAHVGMEVSIKLNNRAKILVVSIAVLLVLAAGIGIGVITAKASAKNRRQYESRQKTEQTRVKEQYQHDTSNYSFQKGKEENISEGK